MTLAVGLLAWLTVTIVVAALPGTRAGTGVALTVAALSLLIPFAVTATPGARFFVAVAVIWVFLRTVELPFTERPATLGVRLFQLVAVVDVPRVERRTPGLDLSAAGRLVTAALATAGVTGVLLASVGRVEWLWQPVSWIAIGLVTLSAFEMTAALLEVLAGFLGFVLPPANNRPHLSSSLSEFWAKRWNLLVSRILRDVCFRPLARRSPAGALVASFTLSGLIHAYPMAVALDAKAAACWAAFFFVQPIFIALERRIRVRSWAGWARRAWTFSVLLISLPLFAEPLLWFAAADFAANAW